MLIHAKNKKIGVFLGIYEFLNKISILHFEQIIDDVVGGL